MYVKGGSQKVQATRDKYQRLNHNKDETYCKILMRYRHLLLILMIASGVAGVFMIPEVNIVSDMTTYLPDDSRMKHGLDSLRSSFNGIDINGAGVSAMFTNEAAHDSLATDCCDNQQPLQRSIYALPICLGPERIAE